jgi:hypothetical protein
MVAYSFDKRFAPVIIAGAKQQTIRARRKRHARPGEALQLYTGMRTRQCVKIIVDPVCESASSISIWFSDVPEENSLIIDGVDYDGDLNDFARADGFANWPEMRAFWERHHDTVYFEGVLIRWRIAE